MALSKDFFSDVGGAVSDLFGGQAANTQAGLKAQGIRIGANGELITAQGTRITAQGTRITAEGTRIGAEGTRVNAEGLRIKAQGDLAEASNYDIAGALARENETYAANSAEIQQMQLDRKTAGIAGGQRADVAASGFAAGGSALDILADSARQGALQRQVLGQQELITEAGYEEQAKSYDTMAAAARTAFAGEMDVAARTDVIANRTDALAGQQDVVAGQQEGIATQQEGIAAQEQDLANKTEQAGKDAQKASYITGAIKIAAGVASLFDPIAAPGGGFTPQAPANSDNPLRINQYASAEPASKGPQGLY